MNERMRCQKTLEITSHICFLSSYAMRWRTINQITLLIWFLFKKSLRSFWKSIMKFSSWIVHTKRIVINFQFSSLTNKQHCTTTYMFFFVSWKTKLQSIILEFCINCEHYMLNWNFQISRLLWQIWKEICWVLSSCSFLLLIICFVCDISIIMCYQVVKNYSVRKKNEMFSFLNEKHWFMQHRKKNLKTHEKFSLKCMSRTIIV